MFDRPSGNGSWFVFLQRVPGVQRLGQELPLVWPLSPGIMGPVLLGMLLVVPGPSSGQDTESATDGKVRVYFGTYTRGDSEGIYVSVLDLASGELSPPVLAAQAVNPAFLAIHPQQPWLYSVGEVGDFAGRRSGVVYAFRIDPRTGLLTLINEQPSGGTGACHVSLDHSGRFVLVANYGGGNASVLPIEAGGRLGEATAFVQHEGSSIDPRRQTAPHAHAAYVDPGNRFAMVVDLGLDRVMIYRFDAQHGTLDPNDPAWVSVNPGAGPRHFAFHPQGRFAYVINELQSSVTMFAHDAAQGSFEELQTISTLPADFQGDNTTAEILVHPTGRFLYGSNRGHDSIAVFAIDPEHGRLQAVQHQATGGQTPRNFGIDPTGQFLLAANQASDNVAVFRIDASSGQLNATGQQIQVPTPVCVRLVPITD
jgi:6-phosphogluconolactonase